MDGPIKVYYFISRFLDSDIPTISSNFKEFLVKDGMIEMLIMFITQNFPETIRDEIKDHQLKQQQENKLLEQQQQQQKPKSLSSSLDNELSSSPTTTTTTTTTTPSIEVISNRNNKLETTIGLMKSYKVMNLFLHPSPPFISLVKEKLSVIISSLFEIFENENINLDGSNRSLPNIHHFSKVMSSLFYQYTFDFLNELSEIDKKTQKMYFQILVENIHHTTIQDLFIIIAKRASASVNEYQTSNPIETKKIQKTLQKSKVFNIISSFFTLQQHPNGGAVNIINSNNGFANGNITNSNNNLNGANNNNSNNNNSNSNNNNNNSNNNNNNNNNNNSNSNNSNNNNNLNNSNGSLNNSSNNIQIKQIKKEKYLLMMEGITEFINKCIEQLDIHGPDVGFTISSFQNKEFFDTLIRLMVNDSPKRKDSFIHRKQCLSIISTFCKQSNEYTKKNRFQQEKESIFSPSGSPSSWLLYLSTNHLQNLCKILVDIGNDPNQKQHLGSYRIDMLTLLVDVIKAKSTFKRKQPNQPYLSVELWYFLIDWFFQFNNIYQSKFFSLLRELFTQQHLPSIKHFCTFHLTRFISFYMSNDDEVESRGVVLLILNYIRISATQFPQNHFLVTFLKSNDQWNKLQQLLISDTLKLYTPNVVGDNSMELICFGSEFAKSIGFVDEDEVQAKESKKLVLVDEFQTGGNSSEFGNNSPVISAEEIAQIEKELLKEEESNQKKKKKNNQKKKK
ncbi:hypothetical protein DDB_G0277483 [Dictyostelium discoideum AX4]|uniref:Uncharacterized protein n=1 Tax=Dictyostelium discoideum TaxID=44689 RepID=Q76NV3_DICDI|nr:hypothetical protein DDB_G0277483 [Dictyostelium discoideum AX4]EAL68704.1 hypothetical protein DDB_G0277483 [Dictyostelium discoideum AX4]|eukprot:XP_642596.1 hypothetical protein DDB_G0277483 [Dictyostelium discoideum AX4]